MKKEKAVVLSSGGLDSSTVMAVAANEGYELYSLTFCYGQRHNVELKAAEKIARRFNAVRHLVINIDLRQIGGSALTDEINVPKARGEDGDWLRDSDHLCAGPQYNFPLLRSCVG